MKTKSDARTRKLLAAAFGLLIIGIGYFGPYSWISAAADQRRAATRELRHSADSLAKRSGDNIKLGRRRLTFIDALRHDGLFRSQSSGIAEFVGGMARLAKASDATLGGFAFTRSAQADPSPVAAPAPSPSGAPLNSPVQKVGGALNPTDAAPIVKKGDVQGRTDFAGVPSTVHVFGTAAAIRRFLEGMDSLPVTVGLNTASITPTTRFSRGHIVLDATLSVTIYFLNPTQFGVAS